MFINYLFNTSLKNLNRFENIFLWHTTFIIKLNYYMYRTYIFNNYIYIEFIERYKIKLLDYFCYTV